MIDKKTYILLDLMNTAFRCKHTVPPGDVDMQVGMALHTMLNSIRYAYKMFKGNHLVACLEGRSWRKSVCSQYKANRAIKQLEKSEKEREDDAIFLEAVNDFTTFLSTKTNVTCAHSPNAEADDMIAVFIQTHPNDNHVIISSDSDYYQLLAPNVKIYNGVTEQTITLEGFFDSKGKPVIDKKTKLPKVIGNPEYVLFEKCIRGDSTDNIFSAYPGVRTNGSAKKAGIKEAFDDMGNKGFVYNNFMLSSWTDADGNTHRVLDRYNKNKLLIDLTAQPDNVRQECIASLEETLNKPAVSNVGLHFLRFCNTYDLKRIAQYPEEFAAILNAKYIKGSTE